ncbi:hypothetical protein GCM10009565_23110 [Amycolatopsis albidoflavus]
MPVRGRHPTRPRRGAAAGAGRSWGRRAGTEVETAETCRGGQVNGHLAEGSRDLRPGQAGEGLTGTETVRSPAGEDRRPGRVAELRQELADRGDDPPETGMARACRGAARTGSRAWFMWFRGEIRRRRVGAKCREAKPSKRVRAGLARVSAITELGVKLLQRTWAAGYFVRQAAGRAFGALGHPKVCDSSHIQ